MTGIVVLEDGSGVGGSNLALDGALYTIGEAIQDIDPRLARWLKDVARRPGGCMDFDLRDLDAAHRAAFWLGVEKANLKFADWDQDASYSGAVRIIRDFHAKRGVRVQAGGVSAQPIDLDEIWYDDEAD